MQVFRAEVVAVEDLTPSLRRITLGGPDLRRFVSTGVPDEYLRLLIPPPGETEPSLPAVEDGVIDFSTVDLDRLRTYTVRRHDAAAGEVVIDVVVHDGGVAAAWARGAAPGDRIGINSPTGLYDPPVGLAWQMLVADLTGVPALCRILEQTPAHVANRVVIEAPDPAHRLELPAHPRVETTWVYGGNGHGPSGLAAIVEGLPRPVGTGYVWVAGESRALRGVRRHLRRQLALPASAYKSVGYWIEEAEQWKATYAALDADTRASLEALWTSDRAEEEIEVEYDERLTALGL